MRKRGKDRVALTDVDVKKLRDPGRYGDGNGLYLAVSNTAAKSWVFIGILHGKRYTVGLGPLSAVSLKDARVKAAAAHRDLKLGIPPTKVRIIRQIAKAKAVTDDAAKVTFDQAADEYFESHNQAWKSAVHRRQWEYSIKVHGAQLRPMPCSKITVADVLKVLSPLWPSETGLRTRGRIESVLDYAKVRGYHSGENPAVWKGNLAHLLPNPKRDVEHLSAMDYRDIPQFMAELRKQDNPGLAHAMEFLVLTATRSSEMREATWAEINFKDKLWVISKQRMKGGIEHRIPLTDAAISILRSMEQMKTNQYVFPGMRDGRPLSSKALMDLLQRMGTKTTAHGFRSSFRDWAGDCTAFPREIAEAALSHQTGTAVERAYRRGDALERRRQLMEAWASYLEPKEGNVIPIGRSSIPA